MSYSTGRVLAVLEMLEAHGRMRGEDLAARLEVDARTIRRYVLTLRDRGIPVEMTRGRYGGYYLPNGYKRPLALTEREALSTAWGLLSIGQHGGEKVIGGDNQQALAKLAQSLSQTTRELVRSLERAVTFADFSPSGALPIDVEQIRVLLSAVASRQRIHIVYRSWNAEITERDVDGYQVVYRLGRFYLVGHCHLRNDLRVFRLDHIQRVAALSEHFDPPEIDVVAAVERALGQVRWRWEYRVLLDLPIDEAAKRIPPTLASLTPTERGVVMHGYADDLAWQAHFLVGLRCSLAVLSPPDLRDELVALAEHVQSLAARPLQCD